MQTAQDLFWCNKLHGRDESGPYGIQATNRFPFRGTPFLRAKELSSPGALFLCLAKIPSLPPLPGSSSLCHNLAIDIHGFTKPSVSLLLKKGRKNKMSDFSCKPSDKVKDSSDQVKTFKEQAERAIKACDAIIQAMSEKNNLLFLPESTVISIKLIEKSVQDLTSYQKEVTAYHEEYKKYQKQQNDKPSKKFEKAVNDLVQREKDLREQSQPLPEENESIKSIAKFYETAKKAVGELPPRPENNASSGNQKATKSLDHDFFTEQKKFLMGDEKSEEENEKKGEYGKKCEEFLQENDKLSAERAKLGKEIVLIRCEEQVLDQLITIEDELSALKIKRKNLEKQPKDQASTSSEAQSDSVNYRRNIFDMERPNTPYAVALGESLKKSKEVCQKKKDILQEVLFMLSWHRNETPGGMNYVTGYQDQCFQLLVREEKLLKMLQDLCEWEHDFKHEEKKLTEIMQAPYLQGSDQSENEKKSPKMAKYAIRSPDVSALLRKMGQCSPHRTKNP